MSESNIDQAAVRDEAGRGAGGAEPAPEERAAAAAVLPMIWGVHISRAVYLMAELRIADLLASGPMTAAQLAQSTRVHDPSLYRVLRLLAALGVLTEQDGRLFGLTVLGERLRAEAPPSVRSWAMLCESSRRRLIRWKCDVVLNGIPQEVRGAWQVQANDYAGGATASRLRKSPDAKICVPQMADSTFHKSSTKAFTFTKGVSVSDQIGIDLSSQTGYDHDTQLAYTVGSEAIMICGLKGFPGGKDPGLIVAGAP